MDPVSEQAASLQARFRERFHGEPDVYRAPGRINLIGEHTDYNEGFVMPVAVGLYTWIAIAPRPDRHVRLHSENNGCEFEFDLDEADPKPAGAWSDYPRGTAVMLDRAGYKLRGADVLIRGEVPMGSGLSSSASLEVGIACALLGNAGLEAPALEAAKICQRAENEFAGVRCGIMDQFISRLGVAGHALMLDCRSLDYDALPLPASANLVVVNTLVKHELAAGEYNLRREQCEAGARHFSAALPGVRSLRDVRPADLDTFGPSLPDVILRRCRHIVSENDRVQQAAAALLSGDVSRFGRLMYESHRSLRDDFDLSCRELDLLVELAAAAEGVHGARMTGGGFGGCTVNLVDSAAVDRFSERIAESYRQAIGFAPAVYVFSAVSGAGRVSMPPPRDEVN